MTTSPDRVVRHPGPELPGGPRFRLTVPDGWVAAPAPRALAVVRPATEGEGFVPNLTVTADLVPDGTTAGQVLDAMLAQYPGESRRDDPAVAPETAAPAGAELHRPHDGHTVHQRVDVHLGHEPVPGEQRYAVTVVSSWASVTSDADRAALAGSHASVHLETAAD